MNIVNIDDIKIGDDQKQVSLHVLYTASFLSRFYQRPLGNPWSVNLIWNTGPGCEEKFCDLAFSSDYQVHIDQYQIPTKCYVNRIVSGRSRIETQHTTDRIRDYSKTGLNIKFYRPTLFLWTCNMCCLAIFASNHKYY